MQVLQTDTAAVLLLEADGAHRAVSLARGPQEAATGQVRVPVGQGVAAREV